MCSKYAACEYVCTHPLCSLYNGQHLSVKMSLADCIFRSILEQILQCRSQLEWLFAYLQVRCEMQPGVSMFKNPSIGKIGGRSPMVITKAFSENTGHFLSGVISVSAGLGN